MRIVAGQWKSRRLVRPDTDSTRPMSDRVRESVFSILGSHYGTPGLLPPIHVADVFSGSGSMGIEALSRGASSCRFFERGRIALAALTQNLESVGVDPKAHIQRGDAWRSAIVGPDDVAFDLVLLDPPYKDAMDTSPRGSVRRYLAKLASSVDADALVVLHHPKRTTYDLSSNDPWHIFDARSFGSHGLTVFRR